MSDYSRFVKAVQNGAETSQEIAEATGLDIGHVQRELKEAVEDGALARYRDGHAWVYQTQEQHGTPASKAPTDDGLMPASRDFDHESLIPTESVTYVPTDGELDKLRIYIENAAEMEVGVRARIGGDSGVGKTTLAKFLAYDYEMPLYTIQGRYTMRESDLLGTPMMAADGSSQFVYGKLVRALLSSRERPTMLLIDEANRARVQALSVLFPALDHRAEVTLEGPRGGEVITGNSNNLIVIATVNEGPEFVTEREDDALNSRFGKKFNIQYLGLNDIDAEADLISERTGIHQPIAVEMVKVANTIRTKSREKQSSIRSGLPTRALINWAESALLLGKGGLADPIMEAAKDDVILPLYDGDNAAMDEVTGIIEPKLSHAPVDPEQWAIYKSDETVICEDCGFEASRAKAERDGITATMDCPNEECGGDLRFEN